MKNYTILKTNVPFIFTLEDERGQPVADVRGRESAEQFAALPGLVYWLNERVAGCLENEMAAKEGGMEATELSCSAMAFAYKSVIDKINGKNE